MRGFLSVLFSRAPDTSKFKNGLIVLSCSDEFEERIARRCYEWLPHVKWTVVKRFEPGIPGLQGETIFSSSADTILKQINLIGSLRRKKADVTILSGTNEPSYLPLKIMAILSGYRSLAIFNENIDAYFACRGNHGTMIKHLRWRLAQKQIFHGKNLLVAALSWIVLFPLAIIYLLIKTSYLVLRKRMRRNQILS